MRDAQNIVSQIVQRIVAMDVGRRTKLVAIDGAGGAGKSTLASSLGHDLAMNGRRVEIVHFDDFYFPSALRPVGRGRDKPVGGDFDWQRLRDEVLLPLRNDRRARYERYDWDRDELSETVEIRPGAIAIVEGISASRRELASLFHLRIWVDCPRDLRLSRGIARDGESSRSRWELDWMPSEDRYVEEHRPHETADLIVSGASG